MNEAKSIIAMISERLKQLAQSNAVVSKAVSFGDRHVLPLCELSMAFGGAGGSGEEAGGNEQGQGQGQGSGGGTAGAARAIPVAVVVVEGQEVRIESLGK